MYNVKMQQTFFLVVLAAECGVRKICVCRHVLYLAVSGRVRLYFMKGSVHARFLRKLVCTLKCNFFKKELS